ncbi:MAG: galactose mutarotase [Lachnoclostridium sp.]|jgi:aldose 1-epimerase|nr:galactose mutarotase [Lachnoclostridium sp.]
MSITKKMFGKTKNGEQVTWYTLENKHGMKAEFIDYGAILVNLFTADKNGKFDDIVLGYDNLESYETKNAPGFGSFIGRHANRIGGASFQLNGKTYQLEKNDGNNNLHGGTPGYNRVMYQAKTESEENADRITFIRTSPDGEQGYPGNLDLKMTYVLNNDNELILIYEAVSDQDTLVNLTNHTYFNLSGHDSGSILDHKVVIKANEFTPTTDDLIPTGERMAVKGTPMDFTSPRRIGDDIDADFDPIKIAGGYDHNFVLDRDDNGEVVYAGELIDEASGRKMIIETDLVGMQLYTGNFIQDENGKGGAKYKKRDGVCFETQFFPNSCNVSSFKSCVCRAGEAFKSVTKYKF